MAELREIRIQGATDGAEARTETLLGREYTVFPVIMLVEGVLQGANAAQPEYVPPATFSKFPEGWNGRPLVMNHPQIQGVYVSANTPSVWEDWTFGYIFNTKVEDNKLKTEAWVDNLRAAELGGDAETALNRLNNGEQVEVSTGVYVETRDTRGRWNSQDYYGVWETLVPDHLAILSEDLIGACSVETGCGANRVNSLPRINAAAMRTFSPTASTAAADCGCGCGGAGTCGQTKVDPMANSSEEPRGWFQKMAEALGLKVHFEDVDAESASTDQVEIPEPTEEQVQALQASFTEALPEGTNFLTQGHDHHLLMNSIAPGITIEDTLQALRQALRTKFPKTYVYVFTATTDKVVYQQSSDYYWDDSNLYQLSYTISADGDVQFTGEPEPVILLTRIVPKTISSSGALSTNSGNNQEVDAMAGEPTTPAEPNASGQGGAATATTSEVSVNSAPQVQSTEDYLASMPEPVRREIQRAMARAATQKVELVNQIKANGANKFTEDQLNAMDIEVLEGIAAFAVNSQTTSEGQPANYSGRAVPGATTTTPNVNAAGASNEPEALMAAPKVFTGKVQSRYGNASYDLGDVSPAGNG